MSCPLIIDSFAGGGASEGIRAAIVWQTYGMNSRPCVCPSDQTVRHALAKPRLGILKMRFDGSRAPARNSTMAPSSVCNHIKHFFQLDEPGIIKSPFLQSVPGVVPALSSGIARFLSKLRLHVSAISQARDHSCGCITHIATLDRVNEMRRMINARAADGRETPADLCLSRKKRFDLGSYSQPLSGNRSTTSRNHCLMESLSLITCSRARPANPSRLRGGTKEKVYTATPITGPKGETYVPGEHLMRKRPRQGLSVSPAYASVLGGRDEHRRARVRASLPELEITLRSPDARGRAWSLLVSSCRCRAISSSDSQSSSGTAPPSKSTTTCLKLVWVIVPGFGINTDAPIARTVPCNFTDPMDIFTVAPGHTSKSNLNLSPTALAQRPLARNDPANRWRSLTTSTKHRLPADTGCGDRGRTDLSRPYKPLPLLEGRSMNHIATDAEHPTPTTEDKGREDRA